MKTSGDDIKELAAAMVKVQSAMKPAVKDAENPHFKSKYADLSAVWDACRAPLTENGLTVWQDVENHGKAVMVTTRLTHTSGQWVEFGPLAIPLSKEDAHGVGSATMYGRRYGLSAAIGVVSDTDDDGNAAVEKDKPQARQGRSRPEPKPEPLPVDRTGLLSDEQIDAVRAAAKAAGVKTLSEFKTLMMRFGGHEDPQHIPEERYETILEQLSMMGAPE